MEIAKANYPAKATGKGVPGKDYLAYLNYGRGASEANPIWNLLGGTNNDNLGISAEVATQHTKLTGYWQDGAVTGKSGEYSTEMVVLRDNLAQQAVEEFLYNDEVTEEKGALHMALVDKVTKDYKEFWAIPTSWDLAAETGDMATYSASFTVIGQPLKKTGFTVTPASELEYDPYSEEDIVFSVSTGTITGLKKGDADVTASNYSIAAGGKSVVIKASYLATLTEGDVTFYVVLADANTQAHVITIS